MSQLGTLSHTVLKLGFTEHHTFRVAMPTAVPVGGCL